MTDEELAWVAGLLEGEGCFGVTWGKAGDFGRIRVEMVSTDYDVLGKLQDLAGGRINGPYGHKVFAKPQWRWRLNTKDEVNALIERLLPHMGSRRTEKIEELLRAYDPALKARVNKGGTGSFQSTRPTQLATAAFVASALGSTDLLEYERDSLQAILDRLRKSQAGGVPAPGPSAK